VWARVAWRGLFPRSRRLWLGLHNPAGSFGPGRRPLSAEAFEIAIAVPPLRLTRSARVGRFQGATGRAM
jgi:hypothetical protein